jgi:hypothetical protein
MPPTVEKAHRAASCLPEPAERQRLDRTVSVLAIGLGVALAVLLGRVAPQATPPAPANRGGVVVVGPLGLVPVAAPALRR